MVHQDCRDMAENYELQNSIGKGTFGEVWLAVNKKDNINCVVKVIKILKLSERELDQALTEVSVLARCQHGNIINYQDAFVDNGSLNIVMEYADGGDLHKRIVNQKGIHFGKEVILDWFVQMCSALKYIHAENILHRDLKSQNIFLTSKNIVKLGDFGIARVLRDSTDCALTTIGTPFYLSPEICQKKPYNHKSDMWAIGCVLYEMCTLHVPYSAKDFDSLIMKILSGHFEPLPSHFGTTIVYICTRLLDKDPNKRLSANEILNFSPLENFIRRYEPAKIPISTVSVRQSSHNSNEKSVRRKNAGLENKKIISNKEKISSKSKDSVLKDKIFRKQSDSNILEHQAQKKIMKRLSIKPECVSSKKERIDKENIDPVRLISNKTYQVKYPKYRRLSSATPRIKRIISQQRSSLSSEEQKHYEQTVVRKDIENHLYDMNMPECICPVPCRNMDRQTKRTSLPLNSCKEYEHTEIIDDVFIEHICDMKPLEGCPKDYVNTQSKIVDEKQKVSNGKLDLESNEKRRPASNSIFGMKNERTVVKPKYRKVSGSDVCLNADVKLKEDIKTIRRSSSYDSICTDNGKRNFIEMFANKSRKSGSETFFVSHQLFTSKGKGTEVSTSVNYEMIRYISKALYLSLQDFMVSPVAAKCNSYTRLNDIFGQERLREILEICRKSLYNRDCYETLYTILSETDFHCLPLIFQYLQLEVSSVDM